MTTLRLSRVRRHGLAGALLVSALGWPAVIHATQTPSEELATLKVADGYEVSLFASEGEGVVKPTQIRFDGDGRLWVPSPSMTRTPRPRG